MRKKRGPKGAIQKRSFLLFELLVSFALVTLCLLPLIKPHLGIHKAQSEILEKFQLENAAQNAFCTLKEQLYENKISWSELTKGTEGKLNSPFDLYLGDERKKSCQCQYVITKEDISPKKNGSKTGLVISVDLHFMHLDKPLATFSRTLYLTQEKVV